MSCWHEHVGNTKPVINDKVRNAVRFIAMVYSFHGAGGGLHCLLDDWNLDDAFFELPRLTSPEYASEVREQTFDRACDNAKDFDGFSIDAQADARVATEIACA